MVIRAERNSLCSNLVTQHDPFILAGTIGNGRQHIAVDVIQRGSLIRVEPDRHTMARGKDCRLSICARRRIDERDKNRTVG